MANPNGPFGLKPFRHRFGVTPTRNRYTIASTYGTSIFTGQVVELTGTTNQIASAAADNADNLGVFDGVEYTDATGARVFSRYWPASTVGTNIVAYVYDDPFIIFLAQFTTLAVTDIGAGFKWVVGSGNTRTGISGAYVDAATTATTDVQLRCEGLAPIGNNAYGAYAVAEVSFMEHVRLNVVGGVGGI